MTFFQLTILLIFSISIFFSDFLFIIFFNNHCDNKNAMKFFNFGKTPTKPIIGVTGPDHGKISLLFCFQRNICLEYKNLELC